MSTPNYDGIYELRFKYITQPASFTPLSHEMRLDVALAAPPSVGDGFPVITALQRNGVNETLDTVVDNFIALLMPFYPVSAAFGSVELWEIPEGTRNGTFVSVYELGVNGVNVGQSRPAGQTTFSFRTIGGGWGRLQLMEPVSSTNNYLLPPYAAPALGLANFMTGLSTPFQGRDNSYFFSNISVSEGENEKLWRKRYRP